MQEHKSIIFIKKVFVFFLFLQTLIPIVIAKQYPTKIISLGPAITSQIYLLDEQDKLVACTIYCKGPESIRFKEKIGTVVDVNVEKIFSLKPDLVIATPLVSPKALQKMRELKIKFIKFPLAKNFNQLCGQFYKLAKIFGKEEEAKKIILEAKKEIEKIKEEVKNFKKVKVFVQLGSKPLFTVTADSFINDFITLAGGINIAKDAKIGLYSREKVLEKNPDVIIIVGMEDDFKNEYKIWQNYKTINAVKEKKIYIVEPYKVCSPTPKSFVDALKEFVKILHYQDI